VGRWGEYAFLLRITTLHKEEITMVSEKKFFANEGSCDKKFEAVRQKGSETEEGSRS